MTLPDGWDLFVAREVVAKVTAIEARTDAGELQLSNPDHKGYRWVQLCVGHPYARPRGNQRLHRYLMMRELGRRLEWWEHVHHDDDAPKDTRNPAQLEMMEACDHGVYHYGKRLRCGHHLSGWRPRTPDGRFTPLPVLDMVSEC